MPLRFGGDHSSGPPIARRLDAAYPRVWRERRSVRARNGPSRPSPPIWPCTTRGLPCRGHYCPRGRLLPYRFTLAKRGDWKGPAGGLASSGSSIHPRRRFIFCGTVRNPAPALRTPGPLALPGALPYGVRTFLQSIPFQESSSDRPARSLQAIIAHRVMHPVHCYSETRRAVPQRRSSVSNCPE